MSELLDKQVNAQTENLKNSFRVHTCSRKPTKKVCNENERNNKKRCAHKNVIHGRKPFIMPIPKTDLHELWANYYGYNEGVGTICLVNG